MLVLGIDTATAVAAVGIMRDGRVLSDVWERSPTGHAVRLAALVAAALEEAKATIGDVDGVALSVGPGSFTGLRVGLSFAKGVAFSGGVRLVGVATLEALAMLAPESARTIAVVLDARRGETYVAVFRRVDGAIERVTGDLALSPEAASEQIAAEARLAPPSVVLGDGTERYSQSFAPLAEEGVVILPFDQIHPRGSAVAAIGERRLELGLDDRAELLVPVYVRGSYAERTLTTEKALS
jgi:tRNA threonylcarbamoyladenosine biosynthesis protein TsaB